MEKNEEKIFSNIDLWNIDKFHYVQWNSIIELNEIIIRRLWEFLIIVYMKINYLYLQL